jgi:hypothetical protein
MREDREEKLLLFVRRYAPIKLFFFAALAAFLRDLRG